MKRVMLSLLLLGPFLFSIAGADERLDACDASRFLSIKGVRGGEFSPGDILEVEILVKNAQEFHRALGPYEGSRPYLSWSVKGTNPNMADLHGSWDFWELMQSENAPIKRQFYVPRAFGRESSSANYTLEVAIRSDGPRFIYCQIFKEKVTISNPETQALPEKSRPQFFKTFNYSPANNGSIQAWVLVLPRGGLVCTEELRQRKVCFDDHHTIDIRYSSGNVYEYDFPVKLSPSHDLNGAYILTASGIFNDFAPHIPWRSEELFDYKITGLKINDEFGRTLETRLDLVLAITYDFGDIAEMKIRSN